MPVYTIQSPDGRKIKIEANDEATALRGAQEYASANPTAAAKPKGAPKPKPNMAADIGKSALAGFQQGATAIAGLPGDLIQKAAGNTVGSALAAAGALTGRRVDTDAAKAATRGALARVGPASMEALDTKRQAALGKDHVPKTVPGEYARTVGQFAAGALAPGSALRRVASVAGPGVLSEAAGQSTRGTSLEAPARLAGALAGATGAVGFTRAAGESRAIKPAKFEAPRAPTLEEIATQRKGAYRDVEQSGVRYTPEAFKQLAADIRADLTKAGIDPDLHSAASKMLSNITARAKANETPSISEIDTLRKIVNRDVAAKADKGERLMGARMVAKIDEFLDDANPKKLTGGENPEAAVASLKRARELFTRESKLSAIQGAVGKAGRQAAKAGTGGNIDNATRQRVDSAADKIRNLTDAERAAVDKVVLGDTKGNALRQVGRLSPEGNGLMQALHLMSVVPTGGASGLVAVGGALSKRAADALTKRNVQELTDLIAMGGKGAAATAQAVKTDAALYNAVIRRLEGSQGALAIYSRPALPSPTKESAVNGAREGAIR